MASYNLIYEPKGRAREYAALACNLYRGCDHGCTYCYAPSATHRSRAEFSVASNRAHCFRADLETEARKHRGAGTSGQVLLCFTCDPYQHLDTSEQVARSAIKILHRNGLDVQVLTKGGSRALRDLDLFTPDDAFATTLTCLDDSDSLEWEPAAALPGDRIATIQAFHDAGIPTWVSLEPVLDPGVALEIIRETQQIVDLFKVGRLNYHPLAQTIDWATFARDAVDLLCTLGKKFYIKRDLAMYLPDGYAGAAREPAPSITTATEAGGQLALFS